ncbi:MAG: DUF6531 domain-containing protein, partial [Verrucomicrobiota bacterium]
MTTESSGSQGTIASGPQSASGYTWWYINWANGYSGWSVQDYIATITIYTLNITSSNPGSGVYVYVGPNDTQGRADGNTAFSRTFASGTSVTLIAPLSASGNNFQKWQLNGSDYSFSTTINFTLSGNYTMTAVFVAAPPVTHTLTIASSSPNSGVSISGNQPDNNSLYGGTTSFNRTFNHNANVSFNAPSTASGNIFQKWQKDGVDLTTSTTASVTLDANHTITAVYAAPPTQAPTVQTLPATSIGNSTATLNGQVTSDGGASILEERFSWGLTAACADGYTSAVTASGNTFSYSLAEVPPGTYYYQAWARNSGGWGHSPAASFNTVSLPAPTISSVNPPTPTGSSISQPFYINGANFVSGCNVILMDITAGKTYANRSITAFSTAQIRIDPVFGTAAHSWSVEIQNPDSQTTGQYQFNVAASGTPAITVTSPTGGDNWTAGTTKTITWSVSGTPPSPINYFSINYSLDSGATWKQSSYFAPGIANSGTWTVPANAISTHARIQIIADNSSGVPMFANQSASDFTISIPGQNPVAYAVADNHAPQFGQLVKFTGSYSYATASGCYLSSYLWDFGDGFTSTLADPSHVFSSPAGGSHNYLVSLQVSDTCGRVGTSSFYVYVTGQALGNNPQQPFSKDPVNLATGNYTYNHVDLHISARGVPFEFKRFYNSKDTTSTGLPLGFGWTHSYNIQLSVITNNTVVIAYGDGHRESYATNGGGGYISEPGIYNILASSDGAYRLTTKEQQQFNFNASGKLTSIADKNANTMIFAYAGPNLSAITDTVGRAISFSYGANNCLTNITDPLGRTVNFAYDDNTNLTSVTDLRGNLTQFGYDQFHQITNAIDPRGNTFVSMQYDPQKRVVYSQSDALHYSTSFGYDFANGITTVTDAMQNVSFNYYDSRMRVVKIVDNLGGSQIFEYDDNNNRTKVIDKNGVATIYAYDTTGNVIAKTNAYAQPTTIAYDSKNNPTNRLDAKNGLTVFSYDLSGNLTNTLNSVGKTNTYQYDIFGQPVTVTDANGNTTTNTYDAFGNLILTRDALGGTNAFTYDAISRKIQSVDALGRTNLFHYDHADNLTSSVNALGKTNFFYYDGNNNRISATDFRGYTATNYFDPKDRLIATQDPLGNSITNDYDALDRKIRVWDAMGGVTRFAYDAVGNLVALTNATGGVTRFAYDPNGNRTNIIDALGNITTHLIDSLNRLVSSSDALGYSSASVYDSLGRRVQGIDPLNRTNFFAYDPMGRLTNFTDTAGGMIINTYDNVGNRLCSTDPNGHTTTNVFDALNRLTQTTDPVGGVLQVAYDAVGNLSSRKDPNGNITRYEYDANNRRTRIAYPNGTAVTFAYDDNGNLTS